MKRLIETAMLTMMLMLMLTLFGSLTSMFHGGRVSLGRLDAQLHEQAGVSIFNLDEVFKQVAAALNQ